MTSARPPLALADFVGEALRHIEVIAPEEALRRLRAPDREGWHFVDVREPDEFAAGHVPSARSSPRGFLEVRADSIRSWWPVPGTVKEFHFPGKHGLRPGAPARVDLTLPKGTRLRSLEIWTKGPP